MASTSFMQKAHSLAVKQRNIGVYTKRKDSSGDACESHTPQGLLSR